MSLFLRLPGALYRHFWAIWGFGLVLIVLVSAGMFWRGWRDVGFNAAADDRPPAIAKPSRLVALCFGVFLVLYIAFMLWGEDFAYQDGHWFTGFTAIGIPRPPSIWTESGRFWPLGYDEYNLIAYLSPTATAYLVFGAILLVVGMWVLYRVMPSSSPTLRLLTFVVLMMAPAFGVDFAELTYADRNVAFAVCMLVFLVDRYDRRPALSWLLPAIVVSYSALYYKETTAALFGGFAISRLLIRASRDGWRSALRSPLEVGILLSCACFGVELASILFPAGRSKYVDENFVGRLTATARYMTADPLLTVFLIAFGIHVVSTLRRGAKFDPLWDALAAGGALHFVAICFTGLEEDYLMGPTELVAALTLLRLVPRWWQERPSVRPILAGVGGLAIAATMTFGTYRLIQRKNVVHQTQRIAAFVVNRYREPSNRKERLYHLDSHETSIMNFVAFLEYKGMQLHRHGEPPGVQAPDFAGDERFLADRCVYYEDYICRNDAMRLGDVVIRLPDDTRSPVAPPGTTLQTLFQVSPPDSFPLLRPLLAILYRVSPTMRGYFRNRPLPDDWVRVSAAKLVASDVTANAQPK